jgi:hypothetical protein
MTSFAPNEMMLQKYIQDKLTENEVEQVELWLADHPQVLEDLEMDILVKQALMNDGLKQKEKNKFTFLDLFTSRKLVPLHLLTYGLVGFLLVNMLSNNKSINTNSVATFVELEKQRGLDTSIIEVQTSNNKTLVLRFFPDSMSEKYTLTMQSKTSNQKIEFKDLQADDFGAITVSLMHENIFGLWEISMANENKSIHQEYSLRIVK